MFEWIGWTATAIFASSYFCRRPVALRRLQALAALLWIRRQNNATRMFSLNDNPFAVLTAVVAPAILTNACSVLCLGTGNRIARVVDRTRVITAELASLKVGTSEYQVRVASKILRDLSTRGARLPHCGYRPDRHGYRAGIFRSDSIIRSRDWISRGQYLYKIV